MGEAGAIERCLAEAGFTDIESRTVPMSMRFGSIDEFVTFTREMSGGLKRVLESQPQAVHEKVWRALARETERFAGADGTVRFENRCHLAVGRA
jgi:hypothetical protein